MDDEKALRLIEYLQARFREIGEPQLADQDLYLEDDPELGRRRARPSERLAQMLEAFERTMALDDEATRREAMDLIAGATGGEVPPVRIIPYDEVAGEPGEPFYFRHTRNLSDLRKRLSKLAVSARYGERFSRGED